MRTRSMRFPPTSLSVSTPAVTASVACCTTSRVTRLARATVDCRPPRFAMERVFLAAGRRDLDAALRRAPARFPAPRRAEPRFFAAPRADFFLADDFRVFLAMGLSPRPKRPGRSSQDSGALSSPRCCESVPGIQ